jgi:hypothetical protein
MYSRPVAESALNHRFGKFDRSFAFAYLTLSQRGHYPKRIEAFATTERAFNFG